jgi:peroxiredoxin
VVRRKRTMKILPIFLIFLMVAPDLLAADRDIRLGRQFPAFSLKRLGQKANISLAQYKGKTVVIDFWASWCEPCRKELPALNDLAKKYFKKGVYFIGVNVDSSEAEARSFLRSTKVNFILLFDEAARFAEECNLESMPRLFILDKKGVIKFIHNGYNEDYDAEIYEKELKTLL